MKNFDLDNRLLELFENGSSCPWTLRNAFEGVQIFGGIGSGKSSGSGRLLALKYLSAGFGGLVLTVKADEKAVWEEYCRIAGRENDLVIVEPGGRYHFNFLEYESTQSEDNKAITDNIVEVLKTVIWAGDEQEAGRSDDAFWQTTLDMVLFNVIDLCKYAYGSLSVEKMYDIVQSLPKEVDEAKAKAKGKDAPAEELKAFKKAYTIAKEKLVLVFEKWKKSLSKEELQAFSDDLDYNAAFTSSVDEARTFKFYHEFFFETFKHLNPKTRSIVEMNFSGFLYRLLREPVFSLFCKEPSNVTPEDCLNGKIILLNLPVKKYNKVGRDCQILFKYIWQRAMEKRDINQNDRPVFLWADEAQNFLHEHDATYQATARSSRISTVYITQNLPNYYAAMGGNRAEYRVKSFIGTLATKIFHANSDIETNKYASELIGETFVEIETKGTNVSKDMSQNRSVQIKLEKAIRPEEFVRLRTGGPDNKFFVQGVLHRQGDSIIGGKNYIKLQFFQNYTPNNKFTNP